MADLLEIDGISAAYGRIQALSEVSLKVPEGAIVALLGSNGAGKSTTLNTVSRLVPVTKGRIRFAGEEIQSWASHKVVSAGVLQVPEGREVFRDMSVRENLDMGAYRRSDATGIKRDLDRVFEYFPKLQERLQQKAGTLSGGEQQMLVIARALMARPSVLLLDEPSLGLAPAIVERIFEMIETLKKSGLTILLVEQNVNQALSVADRAYVMRLGAIVASGTADEIRSGSDLSAHYLGG